MFPCFLDDRRDVVHGASVISTIPEVKFDAALSYTKTLKDTKTLKAP
jgi:hypothetical protein